MIVTEVDAVTAVVVAVKVAVDDPAGTVTLAGTTTLVLLDERVTTAPPGPAGPANTTVPIEGLPPNIETGDMATLSNAAGVTVKVAVADWPPADAVMTAGVLTETPVVVTVNVAVFAPARTVTYVGTFADGLLLRSCTSAPPVPAACESVTVPVLAKPPRTEVGLSARLSAPSVLTWVPTA